MKPTTMLLTPSALPKIALALVVFTLFSQVRASVETDVDPVVREFKADAAVLPSRLQEAGYTEIGDVKLATFIEDFGKTVQVRSVKKIQHTPGDVDGLRDSARWHRDNGAASIAINRTLWPATKPSVKPVLAMHEALGSLGFDDHIYTCSGSIWMLTDKAAQKNLSSAQRNELKRLAQSTCRFAGGSSTGVTGGGDEFAISVKLGMIEKSLKRIASSNRDDVKAQAIDEALGTLAGSDFYVDRDGRAAREAAAAPKGLTLMLDRPPRDPEHITVMMDDKKVPKSATNGWTLDASKNIIHFHGTYDNETHQSVSAMY